jgi:hypothetical protein
MQVARRRWSAVLIAGTARTSKEECQRQWLLQCRGHALRLRSLGYTNRVRAAAASTTTGH